MSNFIHNAWYAVCWCHELEDRPAAKRVLGKDLAVYRTQSGVAAAVEDCCPHRFAPMSLGRVEGENIMCGYHGMEFDRTGACVSIPGQKNVPSRAKIRTFPVVEKYRLIWAWMGAAENADEALIPDVHWLDAPGWKPVTGTTRYDCNWVLLVDNLLDLTHTTFVHQSTIGTEDVANTPITTEIENDRVYVVRDMKNAVPSNFYKRVGGFDGRIDRWQRIWLEPPSVVIIDAGGVPAGGSRKEEGDDGYSGIDTRILSMLLPVDDGTVDQIWAFVRDTQIDDAELDRDIEASITLTFGEDADFLAGQQANMERAPHRQMLNNTADAGVVQTRRLIENWLAADTAAAQVAE
ncbi:MAG: Rieske 2Fe-2S domain-containing protein [Alphaproteobacteria bacterium]